jgi:hypothetical protein
VREADAYRDELAQLRAGNNPDPTSLPAGYGAPGRPLSRKCTIPRSLSSGPIASRRYLIVIFALAAKPDSSRSYVLLSVTFNQEIVINAVQGNGLAHGSELALAWRECQHWASGQKAYSCVITTAGGQLTWQRTPAARPTPKGISMAQKTGKTQLSVFWGKCTGGKWCQLATVDLAHDTFDVGGVYLIWHGGTKPRVVYIGQAAVLRERLTAHRSDKRMLAYRNSGLFVTWTVLGAHQRDGVEAYLATRYAPLVGDRHPDVTPTVVNSPWD